MQNRNTFLQTVDLQTLKQSPNDPGIDFLYFFDPFCPEQWQVSTDHGRSKTDFTIHADNLLTSLNGRDKYFIDFGFNENTGERLYISLLELCQYFTEKKLSTYTEAQVKAKKIDGQPVQLLFAQHVIHGDWADYTIIAELSVKNNRVLLSNHSILQSTDGAHPPELFGNIALIVNCHQFEAEANMRPYAWQSKKIIYFPVHTLISRQSKYSEVFEMFNESIWASLQEGHVFIHCLAGVHRASCVCVSHYLWRYYVLGHTYLSAEIDQIYSSLATRRRGVAGLSYKELVVGYQTYLIEKYSKK